MFFKDKVSGAITKSFSTPHLIEVDLGVTWFSIGDAMILLNDKFDDRNVSYQVEINCPPGSCIMISLTIISGLQ